MTDQIGIAVSSLDSLNATAAIYGGNPANVNTHANPTQNTEFASVAEGGGVTVIDIVTVDAPTVVQGSDHSHGGIDPIAAAIQFRRAESLYNANASIIKAQQHMFGSVLNMLDTEQTHAPEVDTDNAL